MLTGHLISSGSLDRQNTLGFCTHTILRSRFRLHLNSQLVPYPAYKNYGKSRLRTRFDSALAPSDASIVSYGCIFLLCLGKISHIMPI